MPTFQYEAVNAAGKEQKGIIEAPDRGDAQSQLKAQGYFPTLVEEAKLKGRQKKAAKSPGKSKKKGGGFSFSIGKVGLKKMTTFTRQLSTLQDAGLPLLRSVQILESQQRPGMLKSIIADVAEDVESGSSLSDSMAKHPKAFDRRRIKGALIYPAVVISIAVLIVTGIMYFVIPKFQEIFNDFDVELPGLTIWLVNASKWVAGGSSEDQAVPGAVWILLSPFLVFGLYKLIRVTGPGKAATDIVFARIPVIGPLIKKTAIARFTRTLGTLISAGVPILEAILITRDTSGNYIYEKALTSVHDSIRDGETFAGPLRESKVCDPIVVNMIDVGEETGDLDIMLMKIADNYDEEVDVAVAALLSLLEPFMVVILGGIVGTIVLALFLPLVKMIESVSQAK
jgi:type IV pilus assembly protein PilC